MNTTRRQFLNQSSLGLAAGGMAFHTWSGLAADGAAPVVGGQRPLVVSTWGFGQPANDVALKVLLAGGAALDAVEQGIRLVEARGNSSVGLAGIPNAAGVV